MVKLRRYLYRYWYLVIVGVLAIYFQVQCDLTLPEYMTRIVNDGVIAGNRSAIWSNGLTMLGYALISVVLTVIAGYIGAKSASLYARDLRKDIYGKVASFSLEEMHTFQTSSLITRTTNDVQQIQMLLVFLLRFGVSAPATVYGALTRINSSAPAMTTIISIAVAFLILAITIIFTIAIPKFTKVQEAIDHINLVVRENLSGIRVVRAYSAETYEKQKFEHANRHLTKLALFVNRLVNLMPAIMLVTMNGTILAIYWFGAILLSQGQLNGGIGTIMAFMSYGMQILFAFIMAVMLFVMIPRASVSAKRIREVLNTKTTIVDPNQPKELSNQVEVEFKNVSFRYPKAEADMLQDISFIAKKGQMTAFIGSTGSGKSTVIGLIPRFYDVTKGEVLVNGVNVKDIPQHTLRQQIGFVPQKGILFTGSVRFNLEIGKEDASQAEIEDSLKKAEALDFVEKMDQGMEAYIAQGGQNVSGGQKQRLSIARALVRKPSIYIFDDSFSALDFKTDLKLRRNLKQVMRTSVFIVVAQRISTIMNADQIIVLDNGRIVGKGTHQQLLATNEVYQEICQSQMKEEELAYESR